MFQGYTQGAVDFLWGLKLNNERAWFQEHREEFIALVDRPTRELAEQLRDEMTGLYPKLGLELKVSRIYRDARRLFGRGALQGPPVVLPAQTGGARRADPLLLV